MTDELDAMGPTDYLAAFEGVSSGLIGADDAEDAESAGVLTEQEFQAPKQRILG